MGKLELCELVEHIALVFFPIPTPQQPPTARRLIVVHPGIVAGGQIVVAHLQRAIQQGAELQFPVAVDAGVGRPSCAVFRHELLHDAAGEPLRLIEQVEVHAQTLRRPAGVLRALGGQLCHLRLPAQAEHGAAADIALLPQQRGGGGAVHTAGHGD